jgi:hypothetical protein
VAAVAAIIHNTIGIGQTNVVHVSTLGTEMHFRSLLLYYMN